MSKEAVVTPDRAKANFRDFGLLHDITVSITVEVDRSSLTVRELLRLEPDYVLGSSKTAGSPIDVCINGREVARGEIVALGEKTGVRITEILKPGTRGTGARL